jgi:chloramphenicol 3-O-phosphotransferase
MKCFGAISLVLFLSFCGAFNFLQGMATSQRPSVIVLNGVSSSGKTSIANVFMSMVGSDRFSLVSVDNIDIKEFAALDPELGRKQLHIATIDLIRSEVKKGKLVICDTVLDGLEWINLFKMGLNEIKVLFLFVHCPLNVLALRVSERNRKARAEGKVMDQRDFCQVLLASGNMYERSSSNLGIGTFTEQDFSLMKRKGIGAQISYKTWDSLSMRFDLFDTRKMSAYAFLKVKFQEEYAFVLNNYDDKVAKEDLLRRNAEFIIELFHGV